MKITAGLGFDLRVPLHPVLYLSGKGGRFGFIRSREIPAGNFFFIAFDLQPLRVMKKIIGAMRDRHPDGDI